MKKDIIISTILIAIASLLSVLFFWTNNFVLFVLLFFLSVIMLVIGKSKVELKTFIFCSFSGALAESLAVFFGSWTYKNPGILNVPLWLFILWGIASIFMVRVFLFFKRNVKESL